MKHLTTITSTILLAMFLAPVHASDAGLFDRSAASEESYLMLAERDDREERRDERGRSDERQDRRDCRQDEGFVGKDKRDCKQEEVRDGIKGNRGDDD